MAHLYEKPLQKKGERKEIFFLQPDIYPLQLASSCNKSIKVMIASWIKSLTTFLKSSLIIHHKVFK